VSAPRVRATGADYESPANGGVPARVVPQSDSQMRARARAHRRRFLRQMGCRAGDLDAVSRARLALWAEGQARLGQEEHGGARYWVGFKAVRGALRELEQALREAGTRGPSPLERYMADLDGRSSRG